jgi:Fe-S-cluster containining protein
MELSDKLLALERIYGIYDKFAASLDLACRKNCAHCCTTSVTLTTVEAYKIMMDLESTTTRTTGGLDFTAIAGKRQGREVPQSLRVEPDAKHPVWKTQSNTKADWLDKIRRTAAQPHFKPKITTNQLANLCAQGIEPPEEERSEWRPCPFLNNGLCPIYAARPFGCRCLLSRHDCGKEGYADMDDYVLSVNTVFLQIMEHMDAYGCTGNLLDVLVVMASEEIRQAYEDNSLKCSAAGLIPNQALNVLMIPPEHRTKMEPILNSLRKIRI